MTMESRQPEEGQSGSGLVPSSALSSADLWHEILGRLNEVQEGQIKLARAIESLGMIVCDALSVSPQAALGGGEATALARPPQRVSLAAGPSAPAGAEQIPADAQDPAATQRTVDSLLGADVFAPTGPPRDMAAAGSTTSPRFYVAPVPEGSRQAAREPVASGSWPRGRRVARGLAREAPPMTGPAIVPNLTPAAIDALLAAEFGEAPTTRYAPPPVVQATGGGALLNTLLGVAFEAATPSPIPTPPSVPMNPSAAAPLPVPMSPPAPTPAPTPTPTPSRSVAPPPPPPPPPPMAPTRAPAPTAPMPGPAPQAPTPTAPRPMTPPMAGPQNPPWSPTVDPRRTVGAPATVAPPPPPAPTPRPSPGASPSPLLPPPGTPPTPPAGPGAVNAPAAPDPVTRPDPLAAALASTEPPPLSLDQATNGPAPFMATGLPAPGLTSTAPAGPAAPVPPMPGKPTRRPPSAATRRRPWPPRFCPPPPPPRSSREQTTDRRCWPKTSPSWPRGAVDGSVCAEPGARAGLGGLPDAGADGGSDRPMNQRAGRRQVPELPPVFSHRASSPMLMERSADLHMS